MNSGRAQLAQEEGTTERARRAREPRACEGDHYPASKYPGYRGMVRLNVRFFPWVPGVRDDKRGSGSSQAWGRGA